MRNGLRLTVAPAAAIVALVCASLPSAALAAPPSRDAVIESFDNTKIVLSFFPADDYRAGNPKPSVMMGPGWSMGRAKEGGENALAGVLGVGVPTVRQLRAAGYNVLTWDPRGFGESGGTVMADSPAAEGRDAQALVDYLAKQPEALLDAPGDPRLGMAGASYGGGIQWVLAALDDRVDVIAPTIAWNSLVTSLYKDDTLKSGWGAVLFGAGVQGSVLGGLSGQAGPQTGSLDPHIVSAFTQGAATGRISPEDKAWFLSRGPGDELVGRVKIPALINQGTVDSLFTLDEAARNYAILRRNGIPVKLLWFCGGHGICLTETGDAARGVKATLTWLKRYLDGVTRTDTGPRFDWIDQNGVTGTQSDYPLAAGAPLVVEGSGTLGLVPGTTASGLAIAQTRAANAVNVSIPAPSGASRLIQGPPRLTLTYKATGAAATPDTRIYAHIVDDADDVVFGNQTTPVPILLDGGEHTITRPLEIISASAKPGQRFTLQLTGDSTVYDFQRAAATLQLSKIRLELPVVDPSRTPPGYGAGVAAGGAAKRVKLRIARVKGNLARKRVRTLGVVVRTSGGQVRNVVVRLRGKRSRILGASRARTFSGQRTFSVRLGRDLPAGRYTLEAVGRRPQDGGRVRAAKRIRRAARASR